MTKLYDSNEISKLFVFWDDEMPGRAGHDEGADRHGRPDRPSGVTGMPGQAVTRPDFCLQL